VKITPHLFVPAADSHLCALCEGELKSAPHLKGRTEMVALQAKNKPFEEKPSALDASGQLLVKKLDAEILDLNKQIEKLKAEAANKQAALLDEKNRIRAKRADNFMKLSAPERMVAINFFAPEHKNWCDTVGNLSCSDDDLNDDWRYGNDRASARCSRCFLLKAVETGHLDDEAEINDLIITKEVDCE